MGKILKLHLQQILTYYLTRLAQTIRCYSLTYNAIHEKENVAEIIIPRDLIDGELTVLLNGKEIFASSK